MFESKAFRDLKTERTRKYVSISIYGTTQLSDIRWGFEITSSTGFGHNCQGQPIPQRVHRGTYVIIKSEIMNDQNNKKTLVLFHPDDWELRAF
jgi:hypothetical protein